MPEKVEFLEDKVRRIYDSRETRRPNVEGLESSIRVRRTIVRTRAVEKGLAGVVNSRFTRAHAQTKGLKAEAIKRVLGKPRLIITEKVVLGRLHPHPRESVLRAQGVEGAIQTT